MPLDPHEALELELRERIAFLESREVCAAAHDNVDTCGYCQRDALISALRDIANATGISGKASPANQAWINRRCIAALELTASNPDSKL